MSIRMPVSDLITFSIIVVVALVFASRVLRAGETPANDEKGENARIAAFWKWFQENETSLLQFEFKTGKEEILDDLSREMKKIGKCITYELGPTKDGRREFVISADGDAKSFPTVHKLASAAPKLERWTLIKFRPRKDPENYVVEINGFKLPPGEIQFTAIPDKNKVGIVLFMKGYSEEKRAQYGQIGIIYLDSALGEYDVETKVGFIEFMSERVALKIKGEPQKKLPFSELPKTVDALFESSNKSQK